MNRPPKYEWLVVLIALAAMLGSTIAMFNEIDRRMAAYEKRANVYFTQFDSIIPPAYQTKCHWCHFSKKGGKRDARNVD